jgi:hypothetical protein
VSDFLDDFDDSQLDTGAQAHHVPELAVDWVRA